MIRSLAPRIASLFRRFGSSERGVAAVEFALILPFLITLYLGSMEAAALYSADRRVNTISATMGDLVSQWDPDSGAIPTVTMTDYFQASNGLIYPMSRTGLRQVVSFVQVNADGTTKVLWSKGYNGGTARVTNSSYPLPAGQMMNQVARGSWLIASEVYYSYKPMLGVVFNTALSLSHENFFLPRYQQAITAS